MVSHRSSTHRPCVSFALAGGLLLMRPIFGLGIAAVPRYHPLLPSLPMMGLGSGEMPDRGKMAAAVTAACAHGLTIDTAQNYGSEVAIGDGLRLAGLVGEEGGDSGGAAQPFLLCKVDLVTRAYEDPAARMRRQVTRTRANLGVAAGRPLDAVCVHWPLCLDAPVPDEAEARAVRRESWAALEALVDEGAVRHLGVSNWTPALLDELLATARHRPRINEIEFSPACAQAALVRECAARGVACVGYSPYGACWLAKYFPGFVPWGVTDLLTGTTREGTAADEGGGGGAIAAAAAVAAVASELGCTSAHVLLRYGLQHGVGVIPKSLRPARVGESVAALDDGIVALSAAHVARLDALTDARRGVAASLEAHRRIIASPTYKWTPT